MTLAAGFTLGEWVIRPADGSMTSGQTARRLEPLLMDLLVFLASRPRQVVSKDDVLATVWQGRFVSEDTLKAGLYQLRKALGDSAQTPRYLETLPKRGYRLLVDPVPLDAEGRDVSPAAADLYARGMALLSEQASLTDLKQARLYFERTLEQDSDHHAAAAALALVYVQLVATGSDGDLMARARSLATRAANDASVPAAPLALGITMLLQDRDVRVAEAALRQAAAASPRAAAPHRWLAKLCSFSGRHDDAIGEARRALALDPLSLASGRDLLEALFMSRRHDAALAQAQALLSVSGQAPDIQLGLTWIHWTLSDEQRAFDAAYAGFAASGVSREVLERIAHEYADGGMRGVFRFWMRMLDQQAALGHRTLDLLVLSALLGEHDRAFMLLDHVLRVSHPVLLWIPCSPLFDGLRADVRYSGVLARLQPAAAS